MGEYDITTGCLFRLFPKDFVELAVVDVESVELADPSLKEVRFADAVAHATIKLEAGKPLNIIVHIEFQTDDDKNMPTRMVGYIGRLIDTYKIPTHSTVIYLRPQEITDPGIYQYTSPIEFTAKYNVIKIWELDGDEIFRKRILGLLPFTPLMQPKDISKEQWLGKCVQTVEASAPGEQVRKDLLASTSILSGLIHDAEFVKTFISEEVMRESSVVKELLEKERAEAIAQTRIQDVLLALEAKLGTLEEPIKNRILSLQNEELLEHLIRQSVISEKSELEKEVRLLSA